MYFLIAMLSALSLVAVCANVLRADWSVLCSVFNAIDDCLDECSFKADSLIASSYAGLLGAAADDEEQDSCVIAVEDDETWSSAKGAVELVAVNVVSSSIFMESDCCAVLLS